MISSFLRMNSYTPTSSTDCATSDVSSITSRAMPCSGVSPFSRNPVINANMPSGHAALRANRIFPSYSTIAATTGSGLSQWTKPHSGSGHASRTRPPSWWGSGRSTRTFASRGQNRYSIMVPLEKSVAGAERADFGGELLDCLGQRVPCAHQAAAARADELVELPAFVAQRERHVRRQFRKHGVRLRLEHHLHRRDSGKMPGHQAGHGVRVTGVAQPDVIVEQAEPWRRDEAHLRRQLPRLFGAIGEIDGQRLVEENDRFAHRQAV